MPLRKVTLKPGYFEDTGVIRLPHSTNDHHYPIQREHFSEDFMAHPDWGGT